ncbi:MAG TPA: hypothetical protein VJG32_22235 [Anaerolineae bacterium]|nr:hypothetical protein [Anaerolineae bacterium]
MSATPPTFARNNSDVTSDVWITAPPQKDGKPVSHSKGQYHRPADGPNFPVGRVVMNLMLNKAAGSAIDPPVKVRLAITQDDVNRAKGQLFKVGYWRPGGGPGGEWVILKQDIPCAVGAAEVDFAKLGDPPIAISP